MRWGAFAIQAAAIFVGDRVLALGLPTSAMWGLVAVGVVSNLWLARRPGMAPGLFLVLDVALLTGLLYLSGGPTNPFSVIYVVYIAMSAVMLPPAWTWVIAGLSVLAFGLLFAFDSPSAGLGHAAHGGNFQAHLYGMFVAFGLAASLIAYFVSRLSEALRERERALAEAQERSHRWGRLASIATLAAGAAHEIATPLGTIAVAAKEVRRRASGLADGERLVEDADLIRAEVERCRVVLDRMSLTGGEHVGEAVREVEVESLFDEVRRRLPADDAGRWRTRSTVSTLVAPVDALSQMIENLARNGFDASPQGQVTLEVDAGDEQVELRFVDQGTGMPGEVVERAADPFFTTKGRGDRMGLGLFLARTLVDSLGGQLVIESTAGHGTTVRVVLPQNR